MTMIYSLSFEDNAEPEIDFIKENVYPYAYDILSHKVEILTRELGVPQIVLPPLSKI